ncbi:MAG: tetratricopeptide repeat protein [Candidatus Omnitrophota bacterium]|jgi:superkiller protein 3
MKKIKIILLAFILNITAQYTANTQLTKINDNQYLKSNASQGNLQALYDDYIDQGLSYFKDNQLNNAKFSFFKAQEIIPNKNEAYIDMAAVSMKRENYPTAIVILKKAENSGDSTKEDILFYNLGLCLQKMSKYDESREYYDKAVRTNPLFGEALFNRGMLYLKNDEFDMAFIDIINAGILFKKQGRKDTAGKSEEIISYLIEKCQRNEEVAEKLLEEGSKSFENGEHEKAIVFLNVSALCDPENKENYYRLGVMYVRAENLEQAIRCFKKTVELDPADTKAYINLGGAYGKLKKHKEALDVLRKALELEKNNPKIYYNIAMVYLNIGNNKEAIHYLKKAKTLASDKENAQLLEKINETSKLLKI